MDISNGTGFGVSIFTQGCPIHCKGCHNSSIWDFDGGSEYTAETEDLLLSLLSKPHITRLSILGGEPLLPNNYEHIAHLIKRVKNELPHIEIWLWTGYLIEDLAEIDDNNLRYILSNLDYLIDGPFVQEKRDLTLKFRGSDNQRVLSASQINQKM